MKFNFAKAVLPLRSDSRPGQAMTETVIAVLVISFVFLVLFRLSFMLESKILLEHAAMRVARARSVGLNEFMCQKIARLSVIPVSGKRLWPEDENLDSSAELARIPIYMQTYDESRARGVLEYEGWKDLSVNAGDGTDSGVSQNFSLLDDFFTFRLKGAAGIEENYKLYINEGGR